MTMIKFREADLSHEGKEVLESAREAAGPLATLLAPNSDGDVTVALNSRSDEGVQVRVRDLLTYRERALRYGVAGLTSGQVSGRLAPVTGHPIPTEEYLAEIERMYRGFVGAGEARSLLPSRRLVERVRHGRLDGAAAWEAFAAEVAAFCARGGFALAQATGAAV